MMYSSNSVENNKDNSNNDFRDSISRGKRCKDRTEPVLVLLSDLYLLLNSIYVGTSGPSFCPI